MSNRTVPAVKIVVETPDDAGDFSPCRGFILPSTGAITVDTKGGSSNVTIPSLAGGIIHPIELIRIYATGTDASSVILVY